MSLGTLLARMVRGLSWVMKSKNINLKKILSLESLLFKTQMQKQKDLKMEQLDSYATNTSIK